MSCVLRQHTVSKQAGVESQGSSVSSILRSRAIVSGYQGRKLKKICSNV